VSTTTDLDHNCPHCGRLNQAVTGGPGQHPHDGAVALCWVCHRPALFVTVNGHLGVRLPTAEEEADILADAGVRQLLAAMSESYVPQQAAQLHWREEGA